MRPRTVSLLPTAPTVCSLLRLFQVRLARRNTHTPTQNVRGMAQRETRRSTQQSTKASFAVKKKNQQNKTEHAISDDADSAALSLITMLAKDELNEISDHSLEATADEVTPISQWRAIASPPPATAAAAAAAARVQTVGDRGGSSSRRRSRSRSRTRDLSRVELGHPQPLPQPLPQPQSPPQPSPSLTEASSRTILPPPHPSPSVTDASSHPIVPPHPHPHPPPSLADASSHASVRERNDNEVDALRCLRFDIQQMGSWKQGMTNRLSGFNKKIDAAFIIANEGVQRAKDADKLASSAMAHADEALRRAKNVFNTAVNEHGPAMRKLKDRVGDIEKKVDELERDTRSISRTVIAASSSSSGSSSNSSSSSSRNHRDSDSISELLADARYLLREVGDLRASNRAHEELIADAAHSQARMQEQVDLLAKELAEERSKVSYLIQRDYAAASYAAAPATRQPHQQPQQPATQLTQAYAGYAQQPYPMPAAASASSSASHPRPYSSVPYAPLMSTAATP